MLKALYAVAAAASVFVSSSAVAPYLSQAALPPGKAAMLKQAQSDTGKQKFLWLAGASIVVNGIALAASGESRAAAPATEASSREKSD
jgi:hypothetical protein